MKTTHKLFQFAIVSLLAIVITGCDDNTNENKELTAAFTISYYPREVNYSLSENKTDNRQYSYDYTSTYYYYSFASYSNTEIDASEYILYVSTCNVFTANYYGVESCDYMDFQFVVDTMIDDHDYEVEALLEDVYQHYISYTYIEGTDGDTPPYAIDYRSSALTGLNITCDTELFGVEAGGSLNDYLSIFVIDHNELGNHLLSIDNELVTDLANDMYGMSIAEYLAVNPYAPSNITFSFNELPTNLPQTVTFTVDMEIDGTKVVSSTSDPITLI